MTPSTGIITFLAKEERLGVFAEQAEDEIAAINMALGASYGGARAMTATSGGGFALMVEGISLAGMTETPLVIVLAQRPGPADRSSHANRPGRSSLCHTCRTRGVPQAGDGPEPMRKTRSKKPSAPLIWPTSIRFPLS